MIGIILAAGRGSRMRGLTESRPKAMLPVLGKPVIGRVLDQLNIAGITEVIIVIAADDDQVRPYLEKNMTAGMQLTFVVQSSPRGMAHALLETAPYIHDSFILTACDSLYPDEHYQALVATHQTGNAPAMLTLMAVPPEVIQRASSVEIVNGRIVNIVEKPDPANAPSNIASLALYAFESSLLTYLGQVQESSRGELELQDAIQMMMAEAGGLAGLTTAWRWELTEPVDLLEMNLNFLALRPDLANTPASVSITSPVFIEAGVTLPQDIQLGPYVYLENGARIGPGASLKNCVVLRDGIVEAGVSANETLFSQAISNQDQS